ncbi:MAG: acyltransferase [Bacteroidetes bacterium]|nr:acyltransferase [Bacteroidota bacterium]
MKEYLKQIDALRCYAVLGVMIMHLYPKELPSFEFVTTFYEYVPGVPLFFCISGFLITGILITNIEQPKKQLLKNFYVRRILRIFPVYYLTILLLYIVNVDNYRGWFLNDLFYVSNITQGLQGNFEGTIAPHFWSLAVEEQFYLLWPITFILIPKVRYQLFLVFLVFAIGVGTSLFAEDRFFMARTFGCLSFLGSGAILSVLWYHFKEKLATLSQYINVVLMLFVLLVALQAGGVIKITNQLHQLISILVIPVITLRFILGFKWRGAKLIVENRLILYLGKISYGIYIFHLLALYPAVAIKKILHLGFLDNLWLMFLFKILLTIIIASVSWEFFEKRINALKSKFNYMN